MYGIRQRHTLPYMKMYINEVWKLDREVYIIDAVNTPIGRYKGALKNIRPDDMGAIVLKGLVGR